MATNPLLGKTTRIAKEHARFWLGLKDGKGCVSERSFFSCATDGCTNTVDYHRIKKTDQRLCTPCWRGIRSINGVYIQDPWIWQHKDKYSHSEHRGRQVIHWMRCQQGTCRLPCVAARAKITGIFCCKKCSIKRGWTKNDLARGPARQDATYAARVRRILKQRHLDDGPLIQEHQIDILKEIGRCGYCFVELKYSPVSGLLAHAAVPTQIDRMDNARGYIASNCVPCCFSCNSRKNSTTSAKNMLTFMLAEGGNQVDAGHVIDADSYLGGLEAIARRGYSHIARRILAGLAELRDAE